MEDVSKIEFLSEPVRFGSVHFIMVRFGSVHLGNSVVRFGEVPGSFFFFSDPVRCRLTRTGTLVSRTEALLTGPRTLLAEPSHFRTEPRRLWREPRRVCEDRASLRRGGCGTERNGARYERSGVEWSPAPEQISTGSSKSRPV